MKRKIKDFSKFVNEELEMRDDMYSGEETETMPITKPVTRPKPGIGPIPAPVPGTEPDPQGMTRYMDNEMDDEMDMDYSDRESEDDGVEYEDSFAQTEEEEGVYIGTQLMEELARELGVEIVDNEINYDGHVINFYSETEAFDIDGESYTRDERGKKVPIKTVEQVLDFLGGGGSKGMAQPTRNKKAQEVLDRLERGGSKDIAQPTRMMEERFRAGRGRPGRI
jgi:hypothetical protein